MKVLIDGENLRHQLAHILKSKNLIKSKNGYFKFNLKDFFSDLLDDKNLDIVYYTTRVRNPTFKVPVALQKNIKQITDANRKWLSDLTNQNIKIVKAGYLRVRESNSCIHCGKKTLVLQEKGVDVRVATDLVQCQKNNKQVALVSSDSDLTPAMSATKNEGVYIYYICYSGWLNRSVASQAHKTITFDDKLVIKHFGGKK